MIKKGDYVLATKHRDGDICDQWCIGFFSHMLSERFIVVDNEGIPFRHSGFRRAQKISGERGNLIISKIGFFNHCELNGGHDNTMWYYYYCPLDNIRLLPDMSK